MTRPPIPEARGLRCASGQPAEGFGSKVVEREHFVGQPGIGDRARHAPHGAGGLILGQHRPAMFANHAAARHPVGSHSGEHHRQHSRAVQRGQGAEEHIDGRPAMILKRALRQVESRRRAGPRACKYFQVPVAARDRDSARTHRVALRGFAHAQPATAVQALGKYPGEHFRHVLHNEHWHRKALRKSRNQDFQRGGPSGGNADRQHGWNGRDGLRPRRGRWRGKQRRPRDAGENCPPWPSIQTRLLARLPSGTLAPILICEGMNPRQEVLTQRMRGRVAVRLPGRLCYVVRCSRGERFQRHLGAALGERAAHDHRHLVPAPAQLAQRGQSIHHRHFHIQ